MLRYSGYYACFQSQVSDLHNALSKQGEQFNELQKQMSQLAAEVGSFSDCLIVTCFHNNSPHTSSSNPVSRRYHIANIAWNLATNSCGVSWRACLIYLNWMATLTISIDHFWISFLAGQRSSERCRNHDMNSGNYFICTQLFGTKIANLPLQTCMHFLPEEFLTGPRIADYAHLTPGCFISTRSTTRLKWWNTWQRRKTSWCTRSKMAGCRYLRWALFCPGSWGGSCLACSIPIGFDWCNLIWMSIENHFRLANPNACPQVCGVAMSIVPHGLGALPPVP